MSALYLPIDPAPAAAERVITRLPAQFRAVLQWYPPAFRRDVLEPLRVAQGRWQEDLEDRCMMALKLVGRLGDAITAAVHDHHARELLAAAADAVNPTEALITSRLDPVDPLAADQLREGLEWMRALLPVVATTLSVPDAVHEAVQQVQASDDPALRDALHGDLGTFMRGLVLLAAASESVVDTARPLPDVIGAWCNEAFNALHAAIRDLRARGIPLPRDVTIPGFTARQWRERWAARTFQALTDDAMAKVNAATVRRPRAANMP